MIENAAGLGAARRKLELLEQAHESLRLQLRDENPSLLPVVSAGYTHGIHKLRGEIEEYLASQKVKAPLQMRLLGPGAQGGRVSAGTLAKALAAFQELLRREAKALGDSVVRRRGDVDLTLVASAPGSFIVAMEVGEGGQRSLFPEDTVSERAVRRAFVAMRQLGTAGTPDEDDVRPLARLAGLLNEGGIEGIEFSYGAERETEVAALTLAMRDRLQRLLLPNDVPERRVRGMLISLNVEENVCRLRPHGQRAVRCRYAETIEDDVIAALKREVEVVGDVERDPTTGYKTIRRIEGIRVVESFDLVTLYPDDESTELIEAEERIAVREGRKEYQ